MPRLNRSVICGRDEVQVFHLINRCVRRTYLCGKDKRSGRDYSHRKQWIRNRLEELAGIFGLDILGFSVMSNHLHVVARMRPDVVNTWSDDEIALRWWRLFPQRRNEDHSPEEPTEMDLNMIRHDAKGLLEKRRRLSDISWFMRCLVEPIARRSNKEDEVTGRFWEGRFRAQPLLDETAIAACLAYVDLNPIRAGIAETPETDTCDKSPAEKRAFCVNIPGDFR
jgi:REP element-mobilizing transposase RayT